MTSAYYDEPREAAIPVFVWPLVLALSLAVHLALVVFGLADLHHTQTQPSKGAQTEIILERETLVFEKAQLVGTGTAAYVQPDKVPTAGVAKSAASKAAVTGADHVARPAADRPPAQTQIPPQREAIRPAAVASAVVPPKTIVQTIRPSQNEAGPITPKRPSPSPIIPALATAPTGGGGIERVQEAIEKVRPQKQPKTEKIIKPSNVVPNKSAVRVSGSKPLANKPVRADRAKVAPGTLQAGRLSSMPVVKTSPLQQTPVSSVSRPPSAPKAEVKPTGNALIPVHTVQRVTSSTSVAAVSVQSARETASTGSSGGAGSPNAGADAQPVRPERVSRPAPAAIAPVENGLTIKPVVPVEERLAALQPSEHGGTVISPSAPELVAVPDSAVTPEPAETVAPDHLEGIDPLAKVTGYVASHDAGECTHLSVMSAGAKSARVTAFGTAIDPFLAFDRKFAADHGYEADIELRLITQNQCSLLAAMAAAAGIEAPGLLELDRTEVVSGTRLGGVIQRDLPLARIAQAEVHGADLSGRGAPELYLIDDAGQIHDGRSFVRAETSTGPIGGWRFSIPVTLVSERSEETALVLAVWNRPSGKQPAAFGTLPAARIADVLEQPGVYTLTAFKVLR